MTKSQKHDIASLSYLVRGLEVARIVGAEYGLKESDILIFASIYACNTELSYPNWDKINKRSGYSPHSQVTRFALKRLVAKNLISFIKGPKRFNRFEKKYKLTDGGVKILNRYAELMENKKKFQKIVSKL